MDCYAGTEDMTPKEYWLKETTIQQNDRLVLSKNMLHSKAVVKLTGAAKQILIELYMRLKLDSYNSPKCSKRNNQQFFASNNGQLVLTYSGIHKQFGYSTATISKAIDQLVDNGLIEIATLGCGVMRQSHKIALITNWQKYGTADFKVGAGKAKEPVNGGFKKQKNLEKTSEAKAGITSETKAVQGKNCITTSETKGV
jgi:DNA-binding MarR family transcriptional regulator